jgi:hypothetical protein
MLQKRASKLSMALMVIGMANQPLFAQAVTPPASFSDAVTRMEAILPQSNRTITLNASALSQLSAVTSFVQSSLRQIELSSVAATSARAAQDQSGRPLTALPSGQAPPADSGSPVPTGQEAQVQVLVPVTEYQVQNVYQYEWVPVRGHFGKVRYEWQLVCRQATVPVTRYVMELRERPPTTILGRNAALLASTIQALLDKLAATGSPNLTDADLAERNIKARDLTIQVYSLLISGQELQLGNPEAVGSIPGPTP